MWEKFIGWIWKLQGLTCREAIRLSARAMDMPLTFGERARLVAHMILCRWCRAYFRQLRLLRRWTRNLADAETSPLAPELPSKSAEKIKAVLRDVGES